MTAKKKKGFDTDRQEPSVPTIPAPYIVQLHPKKNVWQLIKNGKCVKNLTSFSEDGRAREANAFINARDHYNAT